MIFSLWNQYLYEPLLNILIYIYGTLALENLGLAIIFLTILLRLILLPFTILSHKSRRLYSNLDKKVESIRQDFKDDSVEQKEQIRVLLKSNKVNPWAKGLVLGIQALVLVLLYQVFLGGINKTFTESTIYSWIYHPDFINTEFLGFELGDRSFTWAASVALFLFLEITFEQHKRKGFLLDSELVYRYFFPFAVFMVLWFLPMAKSLFVLTSLIFSFIVLEATNLITKPKVKS